VPPPSNPSIKPQGNPAFTLPPSISPVTLIISPLLIDNQGRRPLMAMATEAPLPLPSRAYLSSAKAPATSPFHSTKLLHSLTLTRALPPVELRPPRHCRPSSPLTVGEVPWTLSSCFFFAPVTQLSFNFTRRVLFLSNLAPPLSSSTSVRRR
jgi:hypothetical protein